MTQQDKSTTARQAERVQPNVVTSETIAAMYSGTAPIEQAPKDKPKDPPKDDSHGDGDKGEGRVKKPFSERLTEVIAQRKEAETKAERAERERDELRARLEALSAQAAPVKDEPRPIRDKFSSDEDYIEAVAEWKADQRLAKREQEQAEARAAAEREQIAKRWKKAQEQARKDISDYDEVIKSSEVQLPGHLHQAILESEMGPHLAYYFSKHPSEAKRFKDMTPTTALRQLGKLEDKLADDVGDDDTPTKSAPFPAVEKSKAPAPITPVKDGRAVDPGPAQSFEEYRARRLAERKR